ncbi:hypothetical protein ACTQ49_05725 [Luteococcus sp. Sow4_B9]|uniref:hypothetical protein n=1 Tax=Luteococcus sp. Sow4_B9 TaxID=3438792 RepID=UPI003F9CB9A4
MGLFGRLLGNHTGADVTEGDDAPVLCAACGDVNDNEDVSDLCKFCFAEHDGESGIGTSYCCGQIYEEGETVCASCGEPL